MFDSFGVERAVVRERPSDAGTFRVGAVGIRDVNEEEEYGWTSVGPAVTWMRSFGTLRLLADVWTGMPGTAYGGRAEVGGRWRDGRAAFAFEGGHSIDPEFAGHVAVNGTLDQDLFLTPADERSARSRPT